ncbi:hypothetical protein FB565_003136 [Actinoplanes lutulentus]|uniref:Uncharacterized protein n=1 Tax=Actinoplanes lutulentus TaxID=1287878 RepID=A0A327YYT6_9ACTN|nr:hypothetical protein [Actinoplanes lutulentus]RAK26058.1 hypothetical protein B0I29_12994 [Actinoplanes lutulentus]
MRLFTASLMTDLSWGNLLPSSHTIRVKSIEE